ncbi:MAG: Rhamnosyltransferase 1 subunit A (plasmid) [Candidatus Erwinia impunctatus]
MSHKSAVLRVKGFNVFVEFTASTTHTNNRTLLINGALATSASFRNWKKFLSGKSDVITFDLPFSGLSKPFNQDDFGIVTLDDEVAIIETIISVYQPNVIASVSWGGAASLKLLKSGHHNLRHVIIASYSFEFNDVMQNYVAEANRLSRERKFHELAMLMNDEVGFYLPKQMKACNYRHLAGLDDIEYRQGRFHLEQISGMRNDDYRSIVSNSPCQFHFINGDLDRHTPQKSIQDVCGEKENTRFYQIPEAGHFLDLEGRDCRQRMSETFRQIFSLIGG